MTNNRDFIVTDEDFEDWLKRKTNMSINDYAAHQARKAKVDKPTSYKLPRIKPVDPPVPMDLRANEMKIEESALTDTFIGKLKKFWGGY
jgi:hypothetical protein